jgi:hypothetical protein
VNVSIAINDNIKKERGEEVKATTFSYVVIFATFVTVLYMLADQSDWSMDSSGSVMLVILWALMQLVPIISNIQPESFMMPFWSNVIALVVHILGAGYGIYKFLK